MSKFGRSGISGAFGTPNWAPFEDVPKDQWGMYEPPDYQSWDLRKQLQWKENHWIQLSERYAFKGHKWMKEWRDRAARDLAVMRPQVEELDYAEKVKELEEAAERDFERFREVTRADIESAVGKVGVKLEASLLEEAQFAETTETATMQRLAYQESLTKARAAASGVGREGTTDIYIRALEQAGRKEIDRVRATGISQLERYKVAGEETVAAIASVEEGISSESVAAGQAAIGASLQAGDARASTIQAQGKNLYAASESTLKGAWSKVGPLGIDQQQDWRAFRAKI